MESDLQDWLLAAVLFMFGLALGVISTSFFSVELSPVVINLEPILSILPSILAVALGGLITTYTWRRITRPELSLSNKPLTTTRSGTGSTDERYRVRITNQGRRAAKNCKIDLNLKGNSHSERYRISSPVCWAEGNNPSRITVNAGETVPFDLLVRESDMIFFPSGIEDENECPIETYQEQSVYEGGPDMIVQRINVQSLSSIDWSGSYIEVTSENAQKLRFPVRFNSDDPIEVTFDYS